MRTAYDNVPHYREAFDAEGFHPDDLQSLDDLQPHAVHDQGGPAGQLPVRDVRRAAGAGRPRARELGDDRRPTVVGYTEADIDTWADLMARSIRLAGGRPGDIVHVAYGYGLFTGGLGAHYGVERLGCTVVPVSGGMTERQVQLIQDFRPRVIMVTPRYFLSLLDEMEREGIDPAARRLEVGIFGAEPWTESMRQEIERRTGMDAVDIYGLSEVMGPGVAQEAATTKDGLHIWEDHFYPEIIDPITEEVLPDGEVGELVFTSLTKQAMPVIRYRTRDLTRLLPGTAVPSMRRMEKITGRTDDMMIIRGVNVFPTQIEEHVLAEPRAVALLPVRADPARPDGRADRARRAARPRWSAGARRPIAPHPPSARSRRTSARRAGSRCASPARSSAPSARPGASSTSAARHRGPQAYAVPAVPRSPWPVSA